MKNSQAIQLLSQSNTTLHLPTWTVGYKNRAIKAEISKLKAIAANSGVPSLSSNQLGGMLSLFTLIANNKLAKNKWTKYNCSVQDYTIYMNAVIRKRSTTMMVDWQECPSLPGLQFLIPRYETIIVQWQNEQMKKHQGQLSGFVSRLWQHECDHLKGKLLTDICQGNYRLKEGVKDNSNGQLEKLTEEYKKSQGSQKQMKWKRVVQMLKYGVIEGAE